MVAVRHKAETVFCQRLAGVASLARLESSAAAADMCGAAATMSLCVQVMNNKQNKQMLTFIGGFAFVLLLLYYLFIK